MNSALWLKRAATLNPKNPALFCGETLLADYACFDDCAAALGHALTTQYHLQPGDRVAIFSENMTEYLEAMYGVWYSGGVIVPINAKLHPEEAVWIIDNSEASIVFASEQLLEKIRPSVSRDSLTLIALAGDKFKRLRSGERLDNPVARQPADLAWLFYTSGTTGKPKGVMISHGNLQAMAFSYFADVDDVYMEDATLYVAPMSHGAGLYSLQHVLRGCRHIVPVSGRFNPEEIFELARSMGNIHLFAAPTMVKRLITAAKKVGYGGEGIKTLVYGGGPMYLVDIEEAVRVFGPRFCQIYGQGESPMTITALSRRFVADRQAPRWRERLASVGTAHSCVEVRVVDETGDDVGVGNTGEVIVSGATVMSGYWRNEQANAKTLKGGWLWTGDIGVLDEDGFLTLKDRSNDLIISGGANIYPREVEEVLLLHQAVADIAVIGVTDPEWGERVVAFVVPTTQSSVDCQQLDSFCLQSLARFKRPRRYYFVNELPKNNYGKVLKTELRLWAGQKQGTDV